MNVLETLKAVQDTMELVEVHGSQNLNRLLGCIQAVGKLREELGKRPTAESSKDEEGAGHEQGG